MLGHGSRDHDFWPMALTCVRVVHHGRDHGKNKTAHPMVVWKEGEKEEGSLSPCGYTCNITA